MSEEARRTPPCPICGRPSEPAARPFCSTRCANVDLGRWLSDHYAIPVEAHEEPEASSDDPDRDRFSS